MAPFLLISDNKERTYVRTIDSRGFIPVDDFPKFPRKTLVLMEKVARMTNGKKESEVLRIVDAAVIGGDDVSKLPLFERLKAAQKFANAYVCRNKLGLVVAGASSIQPTNFQSLLSTLFSDTSGSSAPFPFTRDPDAPHYYYPAYGIRFIRSVKGKHYYI